MIVKWRFHGWKTGGRKVKCTKFVCILVHTKTVVTIKHKMKIGKNVQSIRIWLAGKTCVRNLFANSQFPTFFLKSKLDPYCKWSLLTSVLELNQKSCKVISFVAFLLKKTRGEIRRKLLIPITDWELLCIHTQVEETTKTRIVNRLKQKANNPYYENEKENTRFRRLMCSLKYMGSSTNG